MAKIVLCLILSAIILPNLISTSFPGDGCCVRWSRDPTCCRSIQGLCCENSGFGERPGFPRHHRDGHDDRFDIDRGNFGRDRFGSDANDGSSKVREEFRKHPNDRQEGSRQENGRFDGNVRKDAERNSRQGTERNDQDSFGQQFGKSNQRSSSRQFGSDTSRQGSRRN